MSPPSRRGRRQDAPAPPMPKVCRLRPRRSPGAGEGNLRAARPHSPRCRATPFALGGMPAAGAEDPMFDGRILLDQLLRGDPRSQDRRPPTGSEDLADLLAQLAPGGGQGAPPVASLAGISGRRCGLWAVAWRRTAGGGPSRGEVLRRLSAGATQAAGMRVKRGARLSDVLGRLQGRPQGRGGLPRRPGSSWQAAAGVRQGTGRLDQATGASTIRAKPSRR